MFESLHIEERAIFEDELWLNFVTTHLSQHQQYALCGTEKILRSANFNNFNSYTILKKDIPNKQEQDKQLQLRLSQRKAVGYTFLCIFEILTQSATETRTL